MLRHVVAGLLFAGVSLAQTSSPAPAKPEFEKPPEAAKPAEADPDTPQAKAPAGQNLLGQADTARGEGRRNENVQISLVDNNAARENSQRVGPTATIIEEFRVDRSYFSSEYGNAGRGPIHAQPQTGSGVHGNLFWTHNNSIFTARSFFQAGPVQPARQNQFGAALGISPWKNAFFSFNGSQDINRGMVNGNVLILLPDEHTPLATDPVVRALVQRWLDAYPLVAPNRPDISSRALNTNSPQRVDTTFTNGQLSQKLNRRDTLIARYGFTAQRVDAFQFVKGQNSDTRNKSHTARLTWDRNWSPSTTGDFSLGYDRQRVLLLPGPDFAGPVFINGLTGLGPGNNIPLDRTINQFRAGSSLQTVRGRHIISLGGAATRIQYNGEETDGFYPVWTIRDDFGNSAVTNLRLGKPYQFSKSIGEDVYRAFRNWELLAFLGDKWTVNNQLTLSFGARWEPITKPHDVTNHGEVPFDSDWNNLGGNFGFAYRLNGGLGVLRGAYGVMFGQIFPATYGQLRLNPPYNARISLPAADAANPYANFPPSELDPATARGQHFDVSPDLATPYSYLYDVSWDADVHAGWHLQLGYVGSRSVKLFQIFTLNRGRYVPGIEFITKTTNERRADSTLSERFYTGNFSRAYYDAGRVTLTVPRWKGATILASYWFSKSIDFGSDYTTTGGGTERFGSFSQNELGVASDLKGLSNFDQPHSFLLQSAYDTGRRSRGILNSLWRNWNISSVLLLKSGTPFTVDSGSDGPAFGNADGTAGDRVFLLDPTILGRTVGNPSESQALLPRSAFRYMNAPLEMSGNLGRNTFRKGKIANLNASITRTWTLPRDFQMTLRAESINLTNTPQFAAPGASLAASNFARITNTLNDGRTFRFTLRFTF